MKFAIVLSVLSGLGLLAFMPATGPDILQQALDSSVLIEDIGGTGSGVLVKNGSVTFVWTDAHVVEDCQSVRTVLDPKTGQPRAEVHYRDVNVVKVRQMDGRKIGEDRRLARILKFSPRQDVAVLLVHEAGYGLGSAQLAGSLPRVGDTVIHVGSFSGFKGSDSVATGNIAALGRLRSRFKDNDTEGIVYDQVSGVAHPGSSGGGVFEVKSGQLLGLVTEFLGSSSGSFTHGSYCMTPARRLREFAKKNQVLFALDANIPCPSREDLLAVEPTVDSTALPADWPGSRPVPLLPIPFPFSE